MNYNKMLQEIAKSMTLLYVEDDKQVSHKAKSFLSDYFAHIDSAEDGRIGLDMYNAYKVENAKNYDIVITDINMPHMNGVELCRELIAINSEQAILVVSAHDDSQSLMELINLGIDAFVLKPMEFQLLTKTLYKVANRIYEKGLLHSYIDQLEKSQRIASTIATQNVQLKSTQVKEANKSMTSDLLLALHDDMDELHEWLDIIDASIILAMHDSNVATNKDKIDKIADNFLHYCSILSKYHEFKNLSISMRTLAETMKTIMLPKEEKKIQEIYILLESFVYVLSQLGVRIKDDHLEDISFYDASLSQDLETIALRWKDEEVENSIDFF